MSNLDVKVRRINDIQRHPSADSLELCQIGGYKSIVKENIHKKDDLIVYLPTDAQFTDSEIPTKLGIKDYLAGTNKDRIKAIRLRGIFSEGICIPLGEFRSLFDIENLQEGDDVQEILKIKKYEQEIPISMNGLARSWPSFLPHYDIENLKKPEVLAAFKEGEEIYCSEKLHGSWLGISIGSGLEDGEEAFVCSHNRALKETENNIFWKTARSNDIIPKLKHLKQYIEYNKNIQIDHIAIFGEMLAAQQDIKYNQTANKPGFRAFDLFINHEYINYQQFKDWMAVIDIPTVPFVYQGPFNLDKLISLATGKTSFGTNEVLEGIVVKPMQERQDYIIRRVIAKVINPDYLLRKGNTTEYH